MKVKYVSPADESRHVWKWNYTTPFVNGAKNLGEALRRIEEGASMIRTKGEPGNRRCITRSNSHKVGK